VSVSGDEKSENQQIETDDILKKAAEDRYTRSLVLPPSGKYHPESAEEYGQECKNKYMFHLLTTRKAIRQVNNR
jgi:hypothetical protein